MTDQSNTPTRYIKQSQTLELWVKSGGRCAVCNKFLLEEPYFERRLNLSERAHIAGHKDTAGSPRGKSHVPLAERNESKNLILLCLDHHKMIDSAEFKADYPEDRLLEIKREHEERIYHLTAMAKDRETAVLRVFGAIRGSLPELARDAAIQAVVDGGGRYARFPLSPDRHSIEIDMRNLPDPETVEPSAYWSLGREIIDREAQRISDAIHREHIRHLSVFALARIPLLIYLGFVLDDKVPVELYQKQRGAAEGWHWPEPNSQTDFQLVEAQPAEVSDEHLVLLLSLSGTIPQALVPAPLRNLPRYEISPAGALPNPNLFLSQATLDSFTRTYQTALSTFETKAPSLKTIHLLPAVPVTAAIACGRHLMRHVHPEIEVYDRVGDTFQSALKINTK